MEATCSLCANGPILLYPVASFRDANPPPSASQSQTSRANHLALRHKPLRASFKYANLATIQNAPAQ